jgi:hypothetical protein
LLSLSKLMKARSKSRNLAPVFLNADARKKWVVSFTSLLLYYPGRRFVSVEYESVDPRGGLEVVWEMLSETDVWLR